MMKPGDGQSVQDAIRRNIYGVWSINCPKWLSIATKTVREDVML